MSFQSQRQLPASPIEEVPMLYKKRKESEISPDDRIMEEVKQNFLGKCSHMFVAQTSSRHLAGRLTDLADCGLLGNSV